jgi:ATP-binding cassette, subfamily B, bacterial PglK
MISTLKKINFLITKKQRKGLVILTLLLFVGMVLEVFGLGILIPAISIILEPEMVEKTPLISSIRNYFSEFSSQGFILLFLVAIVVVYLIKSLFIVFLTYKQNRFLANTTSHISNNLFSSYLSQPYNFHLNRNVSELIKNIQIEIEYLKGFLMSSITILIEGGFITAIIIFLISIEPLGAISIGIFFGILSVVFLGFTKKRIKIWGKLREEVDNKVSKIILEGLGGIKDLLILGKTQFFLNNFFKQNHIKARLTSNRETISQIPRFYLEFISVLGLVCFIALLLIQQKEAESIITILGVFVASTFRMIPSLNRIIAAIQLIKFYMPSVDLIFKETQTNFNKNELRNDFFDFSSEIKFANVSFGFNEGDLILEKVNIEILKGQTIGIIGESGSGKSTFVDLLIGLLNHTSGEILIDGNKNFYSNQSWRNKIGYVSQSIYLLDDTIKNNIALGIPESIIDEVRINKLLKNIKLETFINKLKFGINTKVGERGVQLSGGQKQRIGIARALYHNPDILVLDEATSALDLETEKEVMKTIFSIKGEKTIIIVAHRLSTLDIADEIYKVENNKISKV